MVGVCTGLVSSDTAGSPVCGRGPPKLANRPPRLRSTLPFSSDVRIASSSDSSQTLSKLGFESVSGSTAPAASSSGCWSVSGYSSFWIAPT